MVYIATPLHGTPLHATARHDTPWHATASLCVPWYWNLLSGRNQLMVQSNVVYLFHSWNLILKFIIQCFILQSQNVIGFAPKFIRLIVAVMEKRMAISAILKLPNARTHAFDWWRELNAEKVSVF